QAAEATSPVPASLVPLGGSGSPSRLDAAVDSINAGLTVQVLPNSNLILVKYRSSDPVKGAAILNSLLDLYLDQYVKLHEKSGVAEFFTEHRDRFAERLRQSETALRSFQERAGLLSATVQVDPFSRRYVESLSNYVDSQWDLKEAEARVEAFKARLA